MNDAFVQIPHLCEHLIVWCLIVLMMSVDQQLNYFWVCEFKAMKVSYIKQNNFEIKSNYMYFVAVEEGDAGILSGCDDVDGSSSHGQTDTDIILSLDVGGGSESGLSHGHTLQEVSNVVSRQVLDAGFAGSLSLRFFQIFSIESNRISIESIIQFFNGFVEMEERRKKMWKNIKILLIKILLCNFML